MGPDRRFPWRPGAGGHGSHPGPPGGRAWETTSNQQPLRTTRFGKPGPKEQKATPGHGPASAPAPPAPGTRKTAGPGQQEPPGAAVRPGPGPPPSRPFPTTGKRAGRLQPAARSQAPAAPTTRSGNGPRTPPTSLLLGGAPSAGHAASAGLSFPSRDRGACRGGRPRIGGHRHRGAPGGGPRPRALRRDPGRRLPGLSFPVGARSPQAESERSRPPPRPGPHRQARHDLDRTAVAEVPSGVRRRLGHGHCRLLRAARPPRGARRRPFAAPLPADAPAHAHARHARHARRGVEGARERGWRRARQAPARATGAAEGQTARAPLARDSGPGAGGGGQARTTREGRGPGRGGGRVSLATRIGERLGPRPGRTRRRPRGGPCPGCARAPALLRNRPSLSLPSRCLPPPRTPFCPLTVLAGAGCRARSPLRPFALAVPRGGCTQTPAGFLLAFLRSLLRCVPGRDAFLNSP